MEQIRARTGLAGPVVRPLATRAKGLEFKPMVALADLEIYFLGL